MTAEKEGELENTSLTGGRRLLFLASVWLISSTVLMFEITLTRLFSVIMNYHFVFIAVSLAIFGLGLGGMATYKTKLSVRLLGPKTFEILALLSILLALSLIGSAWLLSIFSKTDALLLFVVIATTPFFLAGMFLSTAFAAFTDYSHYIYFADLAGAATGSLLIILVLQFLGGINTGLLLGGIAATTSLLLISISEKKTYLILALVFCLPLAFLLTQNIRAAFPGRLPFGQESPFGSEKLLYRELNEGGKIVYTEWNAYARTDVLELNGADSKAIFTDGGAVTEMLKFDGDFYKIASLAKEVGFFPFFSGDKEKVLVIGAGGGREVLYALMGGSKKITAVEINPAIVRAVRKFSHFNGGVYDYKNVKVVIDEGRSFIRRSNEKYDIIYLPLVYSDAAGKVGFSLIENYIFTTEAFSDYLNHLTKNGRLVIGLHDFADLTKAYTTALTVLKKKGKSLPEASKHLSIISDSHSSVRQPSSLHWPLLILKKSKFSKAESENLLKTAYALNLSPLSIPYLFEELYSPLSRGKVNLEGFISMLGTANLNVQPARDDSPFFYNKDRWVPPSLKNLFLIILFLTALAISPYLISRKSINSSKGHNFILYFSGLGLGFMLVEISLIQRFILLLGYPTLTFSVILFSLLLSGGLGSLASEFIFKKELTKGVALVALAISAIVVIYAFWLPTLFNQFLAYNIMVRSLITMSLIFPLGFLMGMPFPTGLRILKEISSEDVPWMWGVNGIMSVLGSVIAVVVAMVFSFSLALLLGAAAYFLIFWKFKFWFFSKNSG